MKSKLNLSRIINASGKMTALGGSILQAEVGSALKKGGETFYLIEELMHETSNYLAERIGVEAVHIVLSASSGIAQSVGAVIAEDRLEDILNPYRTTHKKREIIIAKGQVVDFGTSIEVPILMGGGVIVEAGYANGCTKEHYEMHINEDTAAIIYVVSHHAVQKAMCPLEVVLELASKHNIPVIVDAAAEGDLSKYAKMGADLVIYSGTKAIEGPTSGLVVGKKTWVEHVRSQYKGIGRVMKIGKEGILGLTKAIDLYLDKEPVTLETQRSRLDVFNEAINAIEGVTSSVVMDGAGRPILRSLIQFKTPTMALKVRDAMKAGSTKIFTRDYRANEGYLEIDIRDVSDDELKEIHLFIEEVIKGD